MNGDHLTKVLIASNSSFIRVMLAATLRRMGFNVIGFARDRIEVIHKCEELCPDILILDAELDEQIDIVISVARDVSENGTAIILIFPVASEGNAEEAARAVKAGVVGFLRKPLTAGEIETRMRGLDITTIRTTEDVEYVEN